MTPAPTNVTQAIHSRYVALTGLLVPYTMQRHYSWEVWLSRGYTERDLEAVVTYIRRRIKDRRREPESLLFRNLIQNTENFGEDLAIAKAEKRAFQPTTQRQSALKAAGRPQTNDSKPARSAAEIIGERQKLADSLKAWREENL